MLSVRDLLLELSNDTLRRLCRAFDLPGGRSKDELAATLSYAVTQHAAILANLLKDELLDLVEEFELDGALYYLPNARSYLKDDLIEIAIGLFEHGDVSQHELADDDDDDDEFEEEEEDDEAETPLPGGILPYELMIRAPAQLDFDGDWAGFRIGGRAEHPELQFDAQDAAQVLRPYQVEARDAVLRALSPRRPQLLHLGTGGGKTRVANCVVAEVLARTQRPVVWMTKDWSLLAQAASDLARRCQGVRLGRIGSGGENPIIRSLPDWPNDANVFYSTIQTLVNRTAELSMLQPALLVWDESHWGENGQIMDVIEICQHIGTPVLGLTATPRNERNFSIAYSKSFFELIREDYLARPIIEQAVDTGTHWVPRMGTGDVAPGSLNELAEDRARNRRIVDHYVRNVGKYGKTFVFACNIDHVDTLTRMFEHGGISARGIHHEMGSYENAKARREFASGAAQVLVNRDMATHGVDVPDARTVFLCRPTASDILFSQMVGRAARLAPNKTTFNIVEFTDNVAAFGDQLKSARKFFQGSNLGEPRPAATIVSPPAAPRAHAFDPAGALTWIPALSSTPEALHGLWYRRGQTFGIEFELTAKQGPVPKPESAAWQKVANALASALKSRLPARSFGSVIAGYEGSEGDKDVGRWNVEFDRSAGWEVTSRVLMDLEGFAEVDAACQALNHVAAEHGLVVNAKTGTHVHLGWRGEDIEQIKRAIGLVRLFEPALATLVAPSRIARFEGGRYDVTRPNKYCRPVSEVFSAHTMRGLHSMEDLRALTDEEDSRYVTFNLRPLDSIQTVEVRLHHGTLEARKILLWVSLWQQMLWAAAHPRRELEPVGDVATITPSRDILELATQYLPPVEQQGQREFLEMLRQRRAEIVEHWKKCPDLEAWVHHSARWG